MPVMLTLSFFAYLTPQRCLNVINLVESALMHFPMQEIRIILKIYDIVCTQLLEL